MTNLSHLNAIEYRLHQEEMRLAKAVDAGEIKLRTVWVEQIKRERTAEYKFLGMQEPEDLPEMSIDDIFAELEM